MKRVGSSCYVHRTALGELPEDLQDLVLGLPFADWTVLRLDRVRGQPSRIMLGWTDSWEHNPHPRLLKSVLLKVVDGAWTYGSFSMYQDAPIYHRKETMLPSDHPRRAEFAALTAAEEAHGLLGRRDIGRVSLWARALEAAGVRIVGHTLESR